MTHVSQEGLLQRLDEAGAQGADLSPGYSLCAEAATAIRELLRLHEHKADGGGRENTATAQATISTEDSASTEPESSGPAAAATREGVIEKARARELRQT